MNASDLTTRALPRRPSLTDGVIDAVHAMVREGDLVPERLYSVNQLADVLQVSRSPVREALLKLAANGLVRFERNRGFYVLLPDPRDLAEIFAVRITLETAAVATLARRMTEEVERDLQAAWRRLRLAGESSDEAAFWEADLALHDLILERSGNRRAAQIVRELRETTRLIGGTTAGSRSLRAIAREHKPVVDALVARDAQTAARLMREHLEHTGRTLVALTAGLPPDHEQVLAMWRETSGG